MKVLLIDNNRINKFSLPSRVEDTFLINYKGTNNKEYLITLDGIDNNWYLKSNGTVNIIKDGAYINELKIETYTKYNLKIVGLSNLLEVYFIPKKETLFKLDFHNLEAFSIGSSESCHICFNNEALAATEATIKKVGEDWIITCINDEEYKVYINNIRVTIKKLKAGDTLFCGSLKIVWMKDFICVNNPKNSLRISGMQLISEKETTPIEVKPVSEEEKSVELYKKDEYFVRYPSIRSSILTKEVVIDEPPGSENVSSMPFILTIGSSIVMVSSTFMMAYNVGYGIYQGREILSLIPQIVMCVAMIIGSLIIPKFAKSYQKKESIRKEKLRQEKYSEYLQNKEREIGLLIKEVLQTLNDNYPSTDSALTTIEKKNRNFWWCGYNDQEFLNIRLGTGKIKSPVVITAPEEHFTLENDNLLEEVYKISKRYEFIDGAPIVVSLKEHPITSIICNSPNKDLFINGLITQIIAEHSSIDVKLVILTSHNMSHRWEFFKYLPHAFSEDMETRFYATSIDDAKIVSNYLEEEIKKRKEEQVDNEEVNKAPIPYYLIITDNYMEMKSISIVDTLVNKDVSKYGFSLLVVEDNIKNVPLTSSIFIEANEKDGVILEKQTGLNSQKIFYLDRNTLELDMKKVATILSNIPVSLKDGPSTLPSSLSFLDMFGVSKIEQLNILNRWQVNNPVISLDTVVGVHENGDKFKLDLHEKFHGPHGLIAGSTGSGKSEFIITYILSMIINYHPYEVQFVLIDYKGGGLAGAFENRDTGVKIPHLVGTITNLDTNSMNRSLVSIQSELNRRQKKFNEVRESLGEGTIDIYKYQKLYREGVVSVPMAHLFIICDEFAELKTQRPEFMQQLISASRIGRSLGIHLILATQKPSGVVNDQIWANSKFKVCLKVQDRSDSMEMLKRPEAASIKEAGRFYLQVGYDDLFDIGQSGWSGAKYIPSDQIINKTDESVTFINNVGYVTKRIKEENKENITEKDYGDQLTNIVKYVYNLGKKENIVTKQLWLDAIPDVIYEKDLRTKYNYQEESYIIRPLIGEYDDPVNQLQALLTINLTAEGNLLIYGVPGSGKERLLMTMLYSITSNHKPEEVNIYIADCGSEALKIFNTYPHVGDIVTIDEADKMVDLFNLVNRELENRKDLCSKYAGSYIDYNTNSGSKLPLMLVIINNYDVFTENYSKLSDAISPLFRDGYKYGIIFIVSAIATNAIRSRSMQNFNQRICLQLPNDSDYRDIAAAPRGIIPKKSFGRGIVKIGDSGYEFQTASFATEKELTNELRNLADVLNSAYTYKAPPIPTIPEKINVYNLMDKIDNSNIPVGYDIDTKDIIKYNFNTGTIIPIVATNIDEVKISFVHAIIRLISSNHQNQVKVIDFANAMPKNMENVQITKEEAKYESAFAEMNNEILKNDEQKEKYYFLIGASFMESKISQPLYEQISKVFSNIKNYTHSHIILVDVSNGIKNLMTTSWYQASVDNKTGIWIGSNAGSQIIIGIPDITVEEKRLDYPYMAVIVAKGRHHFIKYVLDMEESL